MPRLTRSDRRRLALRAAESPMFRQDKVWSRFSNDKVDIAATLARVIRTLSKSLPLSTRLRALSIGSSNEPQFRILESAFKGGLYLLDIEDEALQVVRERVRRQHAAHVHPIQGDYRRLLIDRQTCRDFRASHLHHRRMNLVTLHHSLYYCPASEWAALIRGVYLEILARPSWQGKARRVSGAVHAVLMSSTADDPTSTTHLYNHFAGKFFGSRNDQDLIAFARAVRRHKAFASAVVRTRRSRVQFYTDDFEHFMGVVWMIMLHPNIHRLAREQLIEVAEHVYGTLWSRGQPLTQVQDHLVIYAGHWPHGLI